MVELVGRNLLHVRILPLITVVFLLPPNDDTGNAKLVSSGDLLDLLSKVFLMLARIFNV